MTMRVAVLDVAAARDRGIVSCGTTGLAGVTATVEHTWALILSSARGVAREDAAIRDGGWMVGATSSSRPPTWSRCT